MNGFGPGPVDQGEALADDFALVIMFYLRINRRVSKPLSG